MDFRICQSLTVPGKTGEIAVLVTNKRLFLARICREC